MPMVHARRPFHVALDELRGRLQGPPPRVLYHYTSADGLRGILQSARFWASNVAHLNDSREIDHGADVVHSVIADELAVATDARWRRLLEMTQHFLDGMKVYEGRIYAVSFCSEGDLLSQWRGYAAMGGGYCLGFAPSRFQAVDVPSPFSLRKVFYSKKEQRNIITRVLRIARGHVPQGRRRAENLATAIESVASDLAMELFNYFSSFKDPSFSEEHEWRLVYTFPKAFLAEKLEFRSATTGLKPYVPVAVSRDAARLPIKVVRHGPTLNPQLARHSLELLLERARYDVSRMQIAASAVPYRP